MWEYKVIAGRYAVEGADVFVENAQGKTTLQRALDYYGREGFELVHSHYDGINREVVLMLKRPRAAGSAGAAPGAAEAVGAPAAGAAATGGPDGAPRPAAAGPAEDEAPPQRRSAAAQQGRGRRSKAELDKLYRDTD